MGIEGRVYATRVTNYSLSSTSTSGNPRSGILSIISFFFLFPSLLSPSDFFAVRPTSSLRQCLSPGFCLSTLSPPPSVDTKKPAERGAARRHNVKEKSVAVGSKMQRSDRLVRIGSSVRLCPGTGLVCNGQPYRGVHVARRSSLVASLMLQKKDWFCPKITYIAL